ncbi:glyoxalase superfamily protein [Rhizobium sp. BK176]|uniref:glyoxalase superfamily protein n=1 Tax=Rhizobium sp. BK176 TaxID=2587071 RepID=UPI0021693B4A|nr:glyoxalase superfamily protein [Rhizobium sp. BK176]MCS4088490.1 hypothetical protein [Rhizobium sp. BK176]
MTRTTSEFIEQSRTRARQIKARHEEMGSKLSLAQAYELMAASDGFRTWAAMRAAHENAPSATAVPEATPSMPVVFPAQDHCASFYMIRRYDPDIDEGGANTKEGILNGARISMSYHFFDGEESPAMRFREMERVNNEEYSVVVDIEVPDHLRGAEFHEYAEGRMARAARDNVVEWKLADYPEQVVEHDLVFSGTGRHSRTISWLPAPEAAAPAFRR